MNKKIFLYWYCTFNTTGVVMKIKHFLDININENENHQFKKAIGGSIPFKEINN